MKVFRYAILKFLWAGVLFFVFPSATWAGNSAGMNAYDRGDYFTALKEWEVAAQQGDFKAQNNLGLLYEKGEGVSQDHQKAIFWYRKSAEQGNPIAQFNLGYSYANGRGVPKDLEKALSWYEKSAMQGDASSAFNMGLIYEKERRVRNYNLTLQWYTVAAHRCSTKAMVNLGVMYNRGRGVSQDKIIALKWNQGAAGLGDKYAQYKVGLRYLDQEIIPQDLVRAYMWLSLAGQQDEHQGFGLRDLLSSKMTPLQISKAEELAKEWKSKTCSPR